MEWFLPPPAYVKMPPSPYKASSFNHWTLFDPVVLAQTSANELAGVNAARRAQELATVAVPRDSSYLGTLVDDLVTKVGCAPFIRSTS